MGFRGEIPLIAENEVPLSQTGRGLTGDAAVGGVARITGSANWLEENHKSAQ